MTLEIRRKIEPADLPAAMFHFFPIAATAWFHVGEETFIFAPKFRVQVAQPARRISDGAIRRVPAKLVGYAFS